MIKYKTIITSFSILIFTSSTFAQEIKKQNKNRVHIGIGAGLDYGGFGTKLTYTPIEEISLFGGLGYNLVDIGWNAGLSYNIPSEGRLEANPTIMYGYNAVLQLKNTNYNEVSYGVTAGFNFILNSRKNENQFNFGIYYPFRSKEFMDQYYAFNDKSVLLPITLSVGYNFRLR